MIILETAGIGQSDTEITDHSDLALYVMTPEFGAASQLEKIDMLEFADIVVLNKFDKRGALDAERDVKKQYRRNHNLWDVSDAEIPVFGTIASQFNDPGTNRLYKAVMDALVSKTKAPLNTSFQITDEMSAKVYIIPPARTRYLSEIADQSRKEDQWIINQAELSEQYQALEITHSIDSLDSAVKDAVFQKKEELARHIDGRVLHWLSQWPILKNRYLQDEYRYRVRDREIVIQTKYESLSHLKIPKVAVPNFSSFKDLTLWHLKENLPGYYPYTAGIYPFKREGEDPTRMFAGEGSPERTNKRFHYVSLGMPAHRLSTAFDSVTLYGHDPDLRPDI